MITRKSTSTLLLVLAAVIGASAASMQAQVAPSAIKSPISLTVGGTVSVFDPDYIQNKLVGAGAFIDVNLFHGIGVEAEGRWQRFHEFEGISQDNYLIGPRVQVLHFWRLRPMRRCWAAFQI